MTPLEKVVYLADIIEPGRKFPDAQKLRQIAYEDLDGAVAEAREGSLRHLKKTGEKISPETIEAYDFLRAEQERKNAASAR